MATVTRSSPGLGRVKWSDLPYVDVREHGAVGDGVTDDTAAIQAAIDSLDTGDDDRSGGTIYFPPGVYGLSSKVNVQTSGAAGLSSIKLLGAGMHTTILKPLTGFASSIVIDVLESGYCSFQDFMVDADGKSTDGIVVKNGSQIDFFRVFVQNATAGDGFRFEDVFMVSLLGCRSKSNTNGFNFSGGSLVRTSIALQNCYALNNSSTGYRFFDVIYSVVTACASDLNQYGYAVFAGSGLKFIGCGAESCTRSAWYLVNSAALNAGAVVSGISVEIDNCVAVACNTADAGYGSIYSEQVDTGSIKAVVRKFKETSVTGSYSVVTSGAVNHEVVIHDTSGFSAQLSGPGIVPAKDPPLKTAGIAISAATKVCGLQNVFGHTAKYAGVITVIAANALYAENADASMSGYVIAVQNGSTEVCTVLHSWGLVAGDDTGHPSFTWTVVSNELRATPIASTNSTFYFYIESVGGIRLTA